MESIINSDGSDCDLSSKQRITSSPLPANSTFTSGHALLNARCRKYRSFASSSPTTTRTARLIEAPYNNPRQTNCKNNRQSFLNKAASQKLHCLAILPLQQL